MGALIRAHDWSSTPLGAPSGWPQSLRTAVRLMLNTRHPIYIMWGPSGTCLYNDAYRPSIGPEMHPASLGRSAKEVWSEIWSVTGPQIDQVMSGRGATWHEDQLLPITRNGRFEEIYWTYSFGPIDDEDAPGGVGGVLVICNETTRNVLRERDIVLEAQRQRNLVQLMPGFVAIMTGADHRFEYVNDAFVQMSGSRDYIGRVARDIYSDLEYQFFGKILNEVYSSGIAHVAHEMPIRLSGESTDRFLDFVYQPIRSDTGNVTGIFVGGYDVTTAVRARAALEEANTTLEARVALAVGLQTETENALHQAQKMDAVGQLTGGVAHDFNNFLTVIRSAIDLLQRPGVSEARRERYMAAISDTTDRAVKLTSQLLAFSRRQALSPEVFDVNDSVSSICDIIQTLCGSQIGIVTEFPEHGCYVNADRSQFDTALVNLAINGRDAMDGEGTLTIRVETRTALPGDGHSQVEGNYVAVSITDSGCGIATDTLPHIFDPFFTTKGVGKGTGLGLSQVFGYAKQSGGEISVDSNFGEGATFTLCLPSVEFEPAVAQTDKPAELIAGHDICVLLVEDNVEVGSFATTILKELGCRTVWAMDAQMALAKLAAGADRFDLVFTDVIMPGMNGIDLAKEIRRLHPELPVVLTSGYSNVLVQDGTFGFELVHKPYSIEQLSQIFAKVCKVRTSNAYSVATA